MRKKKISDVTFAFLDTETTGLSAAGGGRICEIAVLLVKDGKPQDFFQTLINPQGPIDPGAQRIHGISKAMVKNSPSFKQLAPKLMEILKDKTLVCHNAPFDLSFMQAEFRWAGIMMPKMPVVDTLTLARRHFRFERNNLGYIAKVLGIDAAGQHRAGNDVRILHKIFEHFLKEFGYRQAIFGEDGQLDIDFNGKGSVCVRNESWYLGKVKRMETLEDLLSI